MCCLDAAKKGVTRNWHQIVFSCKVFLLCVICRVFSFVPPWRWDLTPSGLSTNEAWCGTDSKLCCQFKIFLTLGILCCVLTWLISKLKSDVDCDERFSWQSTLVGTISPQQIKSLLPKQPREQLYNPNEVSVLTLLIRPWQVIINSIWRNCVRYLMVCRWSRWAIKTRSVTCNSW